MSSDRAAALKAKALATGKPEVGRVELPSQRTRMSRTFSDPVTGTRVTQIGSEPINYRDAKGDWQPIDNTLSAVSGGWKNGANAYTAVLPSSLTKPITVADSADTNSWVSLQLTPSKTPAAPLKVVPGAQPSARVPQVSAISGKVSTSIVNYAAALPGVNMHYRATGDGVQETASLTSLSAVDALPDGSLTYTVRTGVGLTLKADAKAAGAVDVVNAKGAAAFTIPASFMDDAKGENSSAVTTSLSADPDASRTWTLTLTPNRSWLAAPDRAWPVMMDPTIGYPSSMAGCTLSSATPTTSDCASSEILTSWASTGAERRGLLRFDTLFDVIPADAQIADAELNLYVVNDSANPASAVDVRALTNPFTTAATWNKRDSANNWAIAGGDRSSTIYERNTLTPNGTYQSLDVAQLVQEWAEGATTYDGFIEVFSLRALRSDH